MFKEGTFADVALYNRSMVYHVHKSIACARSPTLAKKVTVSRFIRGLSERC